MKKLILTTLLVVINWNTILVAQNKQNKTPVVKATINLNTIEDDRVKVVMTPIKTTKDEIIFQIPKTDPGT